MKHWKTLQNGINLLILLCLAVLILCPPVHDLCQGGHNRWPP